MLWARPDSISIFYPGTVVCIFPSSSLNWEAEVSQDLMTRSALLRCLCLTQRQLLMDRAPTFIAIHSVDLSVVCQWPKIDSNKWKQSRDACLLLHRNLQSQLLVPIKDIWTLKRISSGDYWTHMNANHPSIPLGSSNNQWSLAKWCKIWLFWFVFQIIVLKW